MKNFPIGFKPMLAGKAGDLASLRYPVLVSPKIDGIRCLIMNGVGYSRTLKPLPSLKLQAAVAGMADGLDGEIVCPGGFNATQSAVMSRDGDGEYRYMTFDNLLHPGTFKDRLKSLTRYWMAEPLGHEYIWSEHALREYEAKMVLLGYEGVMIRDPLGPYKCGRSTTREGYLLKLKQFADSEARIVGWEQLMTNNNELTTNAVGKSERSSHQANLVPQPMLGALIVDPEGFDSGFTELFNIGTGFTDNDRTLLWEHGLKNLAGRVVKFKYQPNPPGVVTERPRMPVFLGFRDGGE